MATSAASLLEMLNVQHRTEHCRLDEQQVEDHGVNIVTYEDWAHQQRLNPLQREEDNGSDEDVEANDTELGLFDVMYAVHPPLGVVDADRGIWQAPFLAPLVRTLGIGGMHHGVTVRNRGTPTELLNDSTYQGMKAVAQKKQEQAQFEQEQLDRRKEEIAEEQGKLNAEREEMNVETNHRIAAAEARENE